MEGNCIKCGGFIGEPNKAYGYAGKWCYCPTKEIGKVIVSDSIQIITPLLNSDDSELAESETRYLLNMVQSKMLEDDFEEKGDYYKNRLKSIEKKFIKKLDK